MRLQVRCERLSSGLVETMALDHFELDFLEEFVSEIRTQVIPIFVKLKNYKL